MGRSLFLSWSFLLHHCSAVPFMAARSLLDSAFCPCDPSSFLHLSFQIAIDALLSSTSSVWSLRCSPSCFSLCSLSSPAVSRHRCDEGESSWSGLRNFEAFVYSLGIGDWRGLTSTNYSILPCTPPASLLTLFANASSWAQFAIAHLGRLGHFSSASSFPLPGLNRHFPRPWLMAERTPLLRPSTPPLPAPVHYLQTHRAVVFQFTSLLTAIDGLAGTYALKLLNSNVLLARSYGATLDIGNAWFAGFLLTVAGALAGAACVSPPEGRRGEGS